MQSVIREDAINKRFVSGYLDPGASVSVRITNMALAWVGRTNSGMWVEMFCDLYGIATLSSQNGTVIGKAMSNRILTLTNNSDTTAFYLLAVF